MSRLRHVPSDPQVTSTSTSTTTGACPYGRLGLGTRSLTRAGGGARAHFRNPYIPPGRRHTLRFGLRHVYQVRGWAWTRPRLRSAGATQLCVPGASACVPLDPAGFLSILYPSPIQRILLVTWVTVGLTHVATFKPSDERLIMRPCVAFCSELWE